MSIIGDKAVFAIEYEFVDDTRDTEISMFVNGINILEFEREGIKLTTRWNLDEIALWLRNFIDNLKEDPYPVKCEGEFAAQKDDIARNFDTDDDEAFEEYYDKLEEWNEKHRWHTASSGAVLADVYFQVVEENVEISWDNRDLDDDVYFNTVTGGARVAVQVFYSVIDSFLKEYAIHWF